MQYFAAIQRVCQLYFSDFSGGIVLFYTLLMLYFLNPPKLWSAECRFKYLTQTLRLITPALVVWVSC